jgi:phosphoribosylglycinamide formyltransferase 1
LDRLKLVVLASGAGSTFAAIADAIAAGKIKATLQGLIVTSESAGAAIRARELRIPTLTVNPKDFSTDVEWDRALTQAAESLSPQLVILAGFLRRIGPQFLSRFKGQIINTHPSLLPQYGGQGMYGMRVHQAVLKAKEKQSGVTVHWVEAEYDAGPIIAQAKVPVLENDTPEILAERVKAEEKILLVQAIARLASSGASSPTAK